MMTKSEVLRTLEQLPDDATIEDIIEHLQFVWTVEQRLKEAEAGGPTLTQAEVEELAKTWRQ